VGSRVRIIAGMQGAGVESQRAFNIFNGHRQ
jgi:hypothetical protein